MRNLVLATCLVALPAPLCAAAVTFTGAIANLCVLTLSTPGTLGVSTDGTELSSSEAGGVKAVLAVVSTGTNPTVSFTAPSLTGPTASVTGATKSLSYASPGGAAQGATSGSYAYTMNRLLDTLTIDARATNPAGFATGTYTISSTATCQQ